MPAPDDGLVTIPLLGYASDLDPATPGVFVDCMGMEPTVKGWRLRRALTASGTVAVGAGSYVLEGRADNVTDGTSIEHYAAYEGTSGKYKLYGIGSGLAVLTDVSKAANYNAATAHFTFCQYGNYALACNLLDVVQIRDATTAAVFADSAATAIPKAKLCVTWGPPTAPRVMLLHYNDGTAYSDGWWTSHIGGPTLAWTPDIATGAANGRLLGAGVITCGVAWQDSIIAFSADQMWIGQVDPDIVVRWTKIANDMGCFGPYAAIVVNGVLYWAGKKGLFQFDGTAPRRCDFPIQKEVQLAQSSGIGGYVTLASDGGYFLFIGLRTAPNTITETLSPLFLINLLNGKVGHYGTQTSFKFIANNGSKLGCTATAGASGNVARYVDATTAASVTVADGLGLLLSYFGANKGSTLIRGVIPRFLSVPSSYKCTDYFGATMDAVSTAGTAVTVSASPWRADFKQDAQWHSPQLLFNSGGGALEMELIDVQLDTIRTGFK